MKQFGKATLAILLSAVFALPLPAAPRAGTPAKRTRRYAARYRGVPTFADSSSTDDGAYDDPIVRAAAVSALGRYNGAVVAVDPNTGRILTVVNQKIAFGQGYIPCSTIKPTIALAALEENVITRDTMLKVGRRKYMNLTEAMAHSNNVFFEQLGSRMGFETVSRYGRLLGLGELAGYNLPDEHPGSFPTVPPAYGGVARMSSFGEGIQVTPLQLAALSAAFANGGTLYYLQYPHSQDEVENFAPRVKRELNIGPILPEIREGLLAAVLYGTGKSSFDRGGDEIGNLRRPYDAFENRLVHHLRRRRARENRIRGSPAWKHPQREGSYRGRGCRPDLPKAPGTELFCGLRTRRGHQHRQLTQPKFFHYRLFCAAEDLRGVSFACRACLTA